jgi:hypothetical protein
MGCDYIADKDGLFKASITEKYDCTKTIRTVEIKGEPFHGVYHDQVEYNKNTEEMYVDIGTYR